MDRNSILAAFSVPLFVLLQAIVRYILGTSDGWGDIIFGIQAAVALLAAVFIGIALFLLRSRKIQLWYWLIISFVSVPVGFGVLMLFVTFADRFSGYS